MALRPLLLLLLVAAPTVTSMVCCMKLQNGREIEGSNTACMHACKGYTSRAATFEEAFRDQEGDTCWDPLRPMTPECMPPACIPRRSTGMMAYAKLAANQLWGSFKPDSLLEEGSSSHVAKLDKLACIIDSGTGREKGRIMGGHSRFCCPGLTCRTPNGLDQMIHGGPVHGTKLEKQLRQVRKHGDDEKEGFCVLD